MIDITGVLSKLSFAERFELVTRIIKKHRANFNCPEWEVLTGIANDETLTMEERFIVAWTAGYLKSDKAGL